MIQDKVLNVLTKSRQELIITIDCEHDQEKKLKHLEHLAVIDSAIMQRKNDLLSVKSLPERVELK